MQLLQICAQWQPVTVGRSGAPRYCPRTADSPRPQHCRPAEADCGKAVILDLAMRCEPGRFAVRRGAVPKCTRDALPVFYLTTLPGPLPAAQGEGIRSAV